MDMQLRQTFCVFASDAKQSTTHKGDMLSEGDYFGYASQETRFRSSKGTLRLPLRVTVSAYSVMLSEAKHPDRRSAGLTTGKLDVSLVHH
jgi:hypothetical protein